MLSFFPDTERSQKKITNSNKLQTSSINFNNEEQKINKNGELLMLRYCASELSIPTQAVNIERLNKPNTFQDENKFTNMAYGYSYWIEKKYNTLKKMRKFEKTVNLFFNKETVTLPDHFFSYNDFIEFYNDEKFNNFVKNDSSQNYDDDTTYENNNNFYNINIDELTTEQICKLLPYKFSKYEDISTIFNNIEELDEENDNINDSTEDNEDYTSESEYEDD